MGVIFFLSWAAEVTKLFEFEDNLVVVNTLSLAGRFFRSTCSTFGEKTGCVALSASVSTNVTIVGFILSK